MTPDTELDEVLSGADAAERARNDLLLHIAISNPTDADELSRRLERPKRDVHDDIKSLLRDGTAYVYAGSLRTQLAPRIIAAAPAERIREIHDQVLAELLSQPSPRSGVLIALVDSGCTDHRLLPMLIRRLAEDEHHAAVRGAVMQLARSLRLTEQEVLLRRAQDASFSGSPDQVLGFTDGLITNRISDVSQPAAVLAAGAYIRSGRLDRASALLTHVGRESIGHDAAWAVVATLGQGDPVAALAWADAMPAGGVTSLSAGLAELSRALVTSVRANGHGAIDMLARSVHTLVPLGASVLLPETPAALAAILAMGRGEPQTAQVFLERALGADLGGSASRPRHQLLLGWALMLQGQLAAAEKAADLVAEPRGLGEREHLLYWCLMAGISRRRADATALRDAWQEIRGLTLGMSMSLFDLLPVGEMLVTAVRMREPERAQEIFHDISAMLTRAGDPIAWSAPFHWHAVQAAFQSNDTAMLLAPANALATAATASAYAATLAQAGNTWLNILRDEIDYNAVEVSVRALASHGHTWDAARLAGHAALQHPERDGALAMMQLAREVDRSQARHTKVVPQTSALTAREVDVARLVLDGHGYRMIGEQLFISPKTVEHHVARIRGRLGATSRGELLEMLHNEIAKLG